MFCKYCGKEINDGSVFCSGCGKKLTEGAADNVTKAAASGSGTGKKPNKKLLTAIIIGAAAVILTTVLIVVIASVIGNKKTGNYITRSGETAIFKNGDSSVTIVNASGNVTELDLSPYVIGYISQEYDMNRSKAVFSVPLRKASASDKEIYNSYDMYYYDGRSAVKVVDGSTNWSEHYISADGSTVVYTVDDSIYSYRNGKTTLVAENAKFSALSPDGKIIAYYRTDSDGNEKGYYYNGKEVFIVNSGYAAAVSNDAKYVYILRKAADGGQSVYVQKKDDEKTRNRLCSNDSSAEAFFNNDLSQLLISTDDGTFISKNGGEMERIYGSMVVPVVPDNIAMYIKNVQILGIKDFKKACYGTYYSSSSASVLGFSGDELKKIVSGDELDDVIISADEKTLIYSDNNAFYKVALNTFGSESQKPEKIADLGDVWRWRFSQDGKTLYYCNDYFEIYAQKIDGEAVKIFDGSREAGGTMRVCRNKLYFIENGKLYSSDSGKAKEVDTGTESIKELECGIYLVVVVDETGSTYVSSDGRSFKKISDEDLI